MEPKISYRKRRDLMLKMFSSLAIARVLGELVLRSRMLGSGKLCRPCEMSKHILIGYLLFVRLSGVRYEEMEQDSELFLQRHYDHSTFQYHYTRLSGNLIIVLTAIL